MMDRGAAAASFVSLIDAEGRVGVDLPCLRCAYNLRAQEMTSRCPECGDAVAITLAGPTARIDPTGRITSDMACQACGATLLGAALLARCSCGAAVAASASSTWLTLADPRWLGRVARGASRLAVASWLLIAVPLSFAAMSAMPMVVPSPFREVVSLLIGLLPLAAMVIALVGLIMVSAPEHADGRRSDPSVSRRVVRVALLAALISFAGMIFGAILDNDGIAVLALLVWNVACIVTAAAAFERIAGLLRRAASPKLASAARLCWILAGVFTLFLTFGVALAFYSIVVPFSRAFAPATMPAVASAPATVPAGSQSADPNAAAQATTTSAPIAAGPNSPMSFFGIAGGPAQNVLFMAMGVATAVGMCGAPITYIASAVVLSRARRVLLRASELAQRRSSGVGVGVS